jgi:hypothetical protein
MIVHIYGDTVWYFNVYDVNDQIRVTGYLSSQTYLCEHSKSSLLAFLKYKFEI